MFDKLLIANRGAIACRILRTLRTLQVKGVAVYCEADAASLHLMQADEAHSLGKGGAAGTYLAVDKILAIAKASGANAIHPGYGFLSENAAFAQACEDAGIAFVGPTPEQLRVFGLKHTARALARQHGVPLLEGTELLDSLESAIVAARDIGYPVMLKSTAGGGGIGMRVCRSAEELADSFEAVKRLGQNNFSDAGVFIEKYIQRARHLEVQVFGDGQGEVLALGVRDCSVQRRNQKVLEETPAPNLPEGMADELCAAAIKLAKAVNYRSAGTVEFVFDSEDQRFYFLEVNTRLQVEHGVTEQVWGVDLVGWMVQLAAGDLPPLGQLQASLQPVGHAIQARLYAEDPGRDFQPCPGLLTAVNFPPADGQALRIDTWVEAGCEIPPYFDPMIAKLISWAPTRDQASAGLAAALHETRLYGVETNRDYLRQIIDDLPFASGQPWTRCLEGLVYHADTFEVLSGGTQTSVQDYPGRLGYWAVGVPPSGPMDNRALRQGNRLLGNAEGCAALEITMSGPLLRFNTDAVIAVTGAHVPITLDGEPCAMNTALLVGAGSTLALGTIEGAGVRSYLCVRGGLDVPDYLGSKSTFTLGQFGGHGGRALRTGDVLHIEPLVDRSAGQRMADEELDALKEVRQIRVIYGPHAAPEYFTETYIETFFATDWEVHFNSSRTGVRLIGPKPEWVRADGGEAGLHPSNIHDNPYAIGAVDFTGDMPVILGPDGPSLGGFVCPVTIIEADLWQLGQLKAGDRVRFYPVSVEACHAAMNSQGPLNARGSELAREGTIPDTENTSHVPASSRASSLPQGPLNTRGSGVVREGTIPDTENTSDVPPHSRASSLPQGPINIRGSELAREGNLPDTVNASNVPTHSRTSPLPQGPLNIRGSELARESNIPHTENASNVPPHSRTSPLPQGPINIRGSELAREGNLPDTVNASDVPTHSRTSPLPQGPLNIRGSELARESNIPHTENTSDVPAHSRTSPLPQGPINIRGSELAREGNLPDTVNASDVPTHSRTSPLPQGIAINTCGSELAREGNLPDTVNASDVPTHSRTSPLLQGPLNTCGSELAREGNLPDTVNASDVPASSRASSLPHKVASLPSPIILDIGKDDKRLVARLSGDTHLLLEIGAPELDLVLRLRGHALMLALEAKALAGVIDLTPGIRSLQVHYRPEQLPLDQLLGIIVGEWDAVCAAKDLQVASRIVHLPLSWDDPACQLAIEKYMTTVRKDAPWCPSNLEFIRRINDLPNLGEVQRTVFDASYLVMGLGDVYLGAPVATPLDPRHRLVTTKYNPARTWTAENSVGIGGAYMCVYGMEGPGGYQFVGRTLQMWNRYREVAAFEGKPWLLRFFDQIRFYPVSADELLRIRRDFPLGRFALNIEHSTLNLADYQTFLTREADGIAAFRAQQQGAFNAERERWIANGQADFQSDEGVAPYIEELPLHAGQQGIDSHIAGNLWQVQVQPGERVEAGDVLVILESMKMEIPLLAPVAGVVQEVRVQPGSAVRAGQRVVVLAAD
ncbi:5-oxoprolinase/urea amidolyase family protein [Pseudomonas syringae]|uniref:5-oxoprolinase/urea amidolyase family protein n=5 Tax=Pseudomonas syringae TaxID=317 RepID=UPI00034A3C16|nr:5-oxoprolinase/urea amidolyase family protein [Pseudomonas syringae]AQL36288.1 urea ABC transporter substrate-binding protein [Pseudomonas syringae pv. actinidiae ICMP 9853]KCU98908.1 urea short-chain amide or branched-chain amino acid uptake ABC transporter periplasmic solute-binding protein [Pseudomonas syringae pv. actinidiae ICMP 9617]BBI43710.1 acetyl-/propionyl-coenzyme A carboxylase alpha chain [Pseudomonas syringae pv. actinidiae]